MSETDDANEERKRQERREQKIAPEANYGYDFYPERKKQHEWSIAEFFNVFNFYARQHGRCLNKMIRCDDEPRVRLLKKALESHGCKVELKRHMVCEQCEYPVQGGFDPKVNQIVVCQNRRNLSKDKVCGIIGHELTHMFDYCRAKLDFKNLEHLACTEVRSHNFFHCNFEGAWLAGDCTMFKYDKAHQKCVRKKAITSVLAVRNVTRQEAEAVVDKVFDKCYNDLEPFGRRIWTREAATLARTDAHLFGYRHGIPRKRAANSKSEEKSS